MSEKSIGRFQIKEELGRGGMATVYLAYDPRLKRDVALKLLPSYFAHDPEFSARFEREAKVVAALEHGSIVSMYEYGEDGEWPYFVMRLMRGGSLKERIDQGSMSLEDAAHIVKRVAGALNKAHSKNIVHRDLKPSNIMFDEDGEAYLGDFGIVKLTESSESYTQMGSTLGTAAYMSPEQADGKPDIDGRSDLYALGIILYEMLTGTAPYTHDSIPRLLVMHLTSPIPNILDARPDLSPALQTIIEKSMAKEREDRFSTPDEMVSALDAVMKGEMAYAPSTPTSQPSPAAAKKSGIPTWVYAVGGVVVLAIIGIIAIPSGDDNSTNNQVAAEPTAVEQSAGVSPTSELLTSEPPTAEPPTSAPPIAEPPTSAPPTTEPPTSAPPTTEPPTSAPPTTEPPTSAPPTSAPPTSAPPTTEPPTSAPPTTEPPTVESIAVQSSGGETIYYFTNSYFWESGYSDFFIQDGQASFWISSDSSSDWVYYLDDFGDEIYEVEMTSTSVLSDGLNEFGILLMYEENGWSWHEFLIDSDGNAAINYCENACGSVHESLLDWNYYFINTGVYAVNKIRVEVNQGTFTYYVNDQLIGSVTDTRSSGNIGLIMYNYTDEPMEIMFDNFTYTP